MQEDAVAGAVYIPLELMVPQVVDHVTAVSVLPVTVEVNCRVVFTFMESDVGLIVTTTVGGGGDPAITVTLAEAESAAFARLVAVTMQEDAAAGAVYIPLELMVPQVVDHVTAVSVLPVTVEVNCRVVFTFMESDVGLIVTTTVGGGDPAITVILAEAESAAFATLVAVTMQEDAAAGAVYIPLELMVPQVVDHVTAVSVLPVTVEVNCRVVFTFMESDVGLIVTTTVGGGPVVPDSNAIASACIYEPVSA